jgi:hypothetical protein
MGQGVVKYPPLNPRPVDIPNTRILNNSERGKFRIIGGPREIRGCEK